VRLSRPIALAMRSSARSVSPSAGSPGGSWRTRVPSPRPSAGFCGPVRRDPMGMNRLRPMDAERARERLAEERARIQRELEGIGPQEEEEQPEDVGDQGDDLEQAGQDQAIRQP